VEVYVLVRVGMMKAANIPVRSLVSFKMMVRTSQGENDHGDALQAQPGDGRGRFGRAVMESQSVGLRFAITGVTDIRFGDIESDEFSARAGVLF
jgi:hypothetical protein